MNIASLESSYTNQTIFDIQQRYFQLISYSDLNQLYYMAIVQQVQAQMDIKLTLDGCFVALSQTRRILITHDKNSLNFYNQISESFQLLQQIKGFNETISLAQFSTNGEYLATFLEESKGYVILNAEKQFQKIGHTDYVSAYFSPNGKYMLTVSQNSIIWDIEKGFQKIKTFEKSFGVAIFSSDSKKLFLKYYFHLEVHNVEKDFEQMDTFKPQSGGETLNWSVSFNRRYFATSGTSVNSVTYSADNRYPATCSKILSLLIFDVNTNFQLIHKIDEPFSSTIFSNDGKYLAARANNTGFKCHQVFSIQNSFQILSKSFNGTIPQIAFSADSKFLVTGSEKDCNIMSVQDGFQLKSKIEYSSFPFSINFSKDGKYCAIGGESNYVLILEQFDCKYLL
ncbi:hypothetical protein ABPG72_002102 [Tetrahymena utriculariae]